MTDHPTIPDCPTCGGPCKREDPADHPTTTDDLPARLEVHADWGSTTTEAHVDLRAAAARIRELEAENAKLHRAIAMWKQDEDLRDEQDARLTALGNELADFAQVNDLDGPPLAAWRNR